VVRVLAGLAAGGHEVDDAVRLVHALDAADGERAARELVLQPAVVAEAVDVGPAVALGPPEDVAVGQQLRRARLEVRVQPLLDDPAYISVPRVSNGKYRALAVTAESQEVQLGRFVREPERAAGLLRVRVVELPIGR